MGEAKLKLSDLKGKFHDAAVLQAQQLTAAQEAHDHIHNNHHPMRVNTILEFVAAQEKVNTADLCVVAAHLLASAASVPGVNPQAMMMGVSGITQTLLAQHAAEKAKAAEAETAAAAEFEADLAAMEAS